MKKLFTTMALVGAAIYGANAQRSIDLETIRFVMTDTIIIDSISPVDYVTQLGIINNGDDLLLATDSINFATPYGSFYFVLGTTAFPTGDTLFFTPDTLSFTNGPVTGPIDFCDSVWVSAISGTTTVSDPVTAPNCFTAYIVNRNTPTSIFDLSKKLDQITIYPNPTSDNLNFAYNFTKASKAVANVIDITGRVVMTKDFGTQYAGENKFTLNVSSLPNGNYTMELVTDENKGVSKFTVTK